MELFVTVLSFLLLTLHHSNRGSVCFTVEAVSEGTDTMGRGKVRASDLLSYEIRVLQS